MSHENIADTEAKSAREAGFATLGRAIADAARSGGYAAGAIKDAANRRRAEHNAGDRATRFAALARQLGDAYEQGRDEQPLIDQLVALRNHEISG
jgi:hypothetical protein